MPSTSLATLIAATTAVAAVMIAVSIPGAAAADYRATTYVCDGSYYGQSSSRCSYASSHGGDCMWNEAANRCDFGCGESTTAANCTAKKYRGCVFNNATAQCEIDCSLLKDMSSCHHAGHHGQCMWSEASHTCGVGCGHSTMYTAEVACTNASMCSWTSGHCMPKCESMSSTMCNVVRECTSTDAKKCVFNCPRVGDSTYCPSDKCTATGSTLYDSACAHQCSAYKTTEDCAGHSTACGWYMINGTGQCAPHCKNYYGACPSYCKPAGSYSNSRCEVSECGSYGSFAGCDNNGCAWVNGVCKGNCNRLGKSDCDTEPHCRWETIKYGGTCLVDCSLATKTSCGSSQGFMTFNRCVKSEAYSASGSTFGCTPSCYYSTSSCPSHTCQLTNTSLGSMSYQCTTRCSNYDGNTTACSLDASCTYEPTANRCLVACSKLTMANCSQESTGGQCVLDSDGRNCKRVCSKATTKLACIGLTANPFSGECLWDPFTNVCSDTCYKKSINSESECKTKYPACWYNTWSRSSYECQPRCHLANGYSTYYCSGYSSIYGCEPLPMPRADRSAPLGNCTQQCSDFGSSHTSTCGSSPGCQLYPDMRSGKRCAAPCSQYSSASECDVHANQCMWTGSSCELHCHLVHYSNYTCPSHCAKTRYGYCESRCSDFKTLASCESRSCVWDTVSSKCYSTCDVVPVSGCEVGTHGMCHLGKNIYGEQVCSMNCTRDNYGTCTNKGNLQCTSYTHTLGWDKIKFCDQRCSMYSSSTCPTDKMCKVGTLATRTQSRTSSGNSACHFNCSDSELQSSHGNCTGRSLGDCAWFGKDPENPSKQPCQLSCEEYGSSALCPTDRCMQAYRHPYCRTKCSQLPDQSTCRLHDTCVWDSVNDKCRDACSAIGAAGYNEFQGCEERLPWCKKHQEYDGDQVCSIDCSLADRYQCGSLTANFPHCTYNQYTKQCEDDCRDFGKSSCPLTRGCMLTNNTRSYSSQNAPACTLNCSVFDGDEFNCTSHIRDCVFLRETKQCAMNCKVLGYLPDDRKPEHCRTDVSCSNYKNCRNNCTLLSNGTCNADSYCQWTGPNGHGCDVKCSTLGSYERSLRPYCSVYIEQPTPEIAEFGPRRVWPGPDTPDLQTSSIVSQPNGGDDVTASVGGTPSTPAPSTKTSFFMVATFEGDSNVFSSLVDNKTESLKNSIGSDIATAILREQGDGNVQVVVDEVKVSANGTLTVTFTATTSVSGSKAAAAVLAEQSNFNSFPALRSMYQTETAAAGTTPVPLQLTAVETLGVVDNTPRNCGVFTAFAAVLVALAIFVF